MKPHQPAIPTNQPPNQPKATPLSTKFSLRPAPRKRPWTCKRSPPCLIPLPIPPTVLCTYVLDVMDGPHAGMHLAGSYLLNYDGFHWRYYGLDPVPGANFECWWVYSPPAPKASATSTYQTPSYTDWISWMPMPTAPYPLFKWSSHNPQGTIYRVKGQCLVTA